VLYGRPGVKLLRGEAFFVCLRIKNFCFGRR
jgi:hypothetical protein